MNYQVPIEYQYKNSKHSSKVTITGNDKSEALTLLEQNLTIGNIDVANQITAELLLSGFHGILLEFLLIYYFKHINFKHYYLFDYISRQLSLYETIKKSLVGNLKSLCNHQELRNHLTELVTLLCISPKYHCVIPANTSESNLIVSDKIKKLLTIFTSNIPPNSHLYKVLAHFMTCYFDNHLDSCLSDIYWFVSNEDQTIDVEIDGKIPQILHNKTILLIIKFVILQIKAQINACKISDGEDISNTLVNLIDNYVTHYKRKDYETCTYISLFMVLLSKSIPKLGGLTPVDITQPQVISACLSVNQTYIQLTQNQQKEDVDEDVVQHESNPKGKHKGNLQVPKTSKKMSKKDAAKQKMLDMFYQNPRNVEFLRVINSDELIFHQQPIKIFNEKRSPEYIYITDQLSDEDCSSSSDESSV